MNTNKINTGLLIFDDVQTMDFAAPLEVFDKSGLNVFTVAKTLETVNTSPDQELIQSFEYTNHPEIEILVIPGGRDLDQASDPAEIRWIQMTSGTAKYTRGRSFI